MLRILRRRLGIAAKEALPRPVKALVKQIPGAKFFRPLTAKTPPTPIEPGLNRPQINAGILARAKDRLHMGTTAPISETSPSRLWGGFIESMSKKIEGFQAAAEAIDYAQKEVGFDHRVPASTSMASIQTLNWLPHLDGKLEHEFPQYGDVFDLIGDSRFSRPETLATFRGRPVSNVFYVHLRHLLYCLTFTGKPNTVCEVGSGYGGLARLWLQNPIHRPATYVLVDYPECLFFADVFLGANFPDLEPLYISDTEPLDPSSLDRRSVILCPVSSVDALRSLSFDLVINTGSFQEMTEDAVDFWMSWLDRQDCRYLYSQNYFAQPLSYLGQAANTWSPRLGPRWTVRHQQVDPYIAKTQSGMNFAEILAEKMETGPEASPEEFKARYRWLRERKLDNQTLLETMDVLRLFPHHELMFDLLKRCVSDRYSVPAEAFYLADYLDKNADDSFLAGHGEELTGLISRLRSLRSMGKEDTL